MLRVEKGWVTPRRVSSWSCFAHAGPVEPKDGLPREYIIGLEGSTMCCSTLASFSQVSVMSFETLQELWLLSGATDEDSDNGRGGEETAVG